MDEVLTPDSSRFWPAPVNVGQDQPSFDKQYLRNWLTETGRKGKEGVSNFQIGLVRLATESMEFVFET